MSMKFNNFPVLPLYLVRFYLQFRFILLWLQSVYDFMQRIKIEGIKIDPWFQKNYIPIQGRKDERVSLDDVCAVFDDIEVRFLLRHDTWKYFQCTGRRKYYLYLLNKDVNDLISFALFFFTKMIGLLCI